MVHRDSHRQQEGEMLHAAPLTKPHQRSHEGQDPVESHEHGEG